MRKFLTVAVLVAVTTGIVVYEVLPAGSATGRTIHLTEKLISQSFNPAPGSTQTLLAQGSTFASNGNLLDSQGRVVGHDGVHGVITSAAAGDTTGEIVLVVTAVLKDGQLAFQGLADSAANGGTLALTGGTGVYRNARGEVNFRNIDQQTTDVVVTLT